MAATIDDFQVVLAGDGSYQKHVICGPVQGPDPVDDADLVTKQWVIGAIGSGYVGDAPISVAAGHISIAAAGSASSGCVTTGAQHFAGTKEFDSLPTIPETPSANTDAASKGYVDSVVSPPTTATVNTTATGGFAGAQPFTMKFVMRNGFVQMSISGFPPIAQTGAAYVTVTAPVPPSFQPSISPTMFIIPSDNAVAVNAYITVSHITGGVTISATAPGGLFSGVGNLYIPFTSALYALSYA